MEYEENLELQNALRRITELADEVNQLRRRNATFELQYENRFQEQIENLSLDNSRLQYEVRELRREVHDLRQDVRHKQELAERVVSELNKLQTQLRTATDARPDWLRETHYVDPSLGFVLMPYRPDWFPSVLGIVENALKAKGLRCETAKDMRGGVVMADVWKGISSCRLVVADMTGNNPNVAYETALADVLGKSVAILCQRTHQDELAFDFAGRRLIIYDVDDLPNLQRDLSKWVGQMS